MHAFMKNILIILFSGFFLCSGSAKSDSVKTFLHDGFAGKKDCMVIGLVDETGSKVFADGNLDNGTTNPVNGDSVFFIGSVSKTFTALLLQDMADRGELKLDDPVQKYLPKSVTMPTHGNKEVTLLNLATHTSGFPHDPDNMTGKDWKEQFETYTVEKLYTYLSRYRLSRDPGIEFEYSNHGMALLGHVLTLKAATNFDALLVNRIFDPLHMNSTRIVPTAEMKSRLAMGHDSGKLSPPVQLDVYAPAGAVHSTVNDLLKFVSAQAGIRSSVLTATMQKTHVLRYKDSNPHKPGRPNKDFGQIGMGWFSSPVFQAPDMDVREHVGGAGSYHAWVGFDIKRQRGVVVLTTTDRYSVEAVGQAVIRGLSLKDNVIEIDSEPVGIGAALEVDLKTHALRITKIIPNSPASHAGLSEGLIIQKIDNVPIGTNSLAQCVNLIRGKAGTTVRLQVIDPKLNATNDVDLTRQKIVVTKQ